VDDDSVPTTLPTDAALKLRRARTHLAELQKEVATYLAGEPFEIYTESEPDRGPLIYRIRVRTDPPADIGLILGDALHNAHCALDYAVHDLVKAGGGHVKPATRFPAAKNRQAFMETVKGNMQGASAQARATMRTVEAYPGGTGHQLWQLHQLDIDDKHKVIKPVGMAYSAFNIHFGGAAEALGGIQLVPDDPLYPITDGAEVMRIEEQPRFAEPHPLDPEQYEFAFSVAIEAPGEGPVRVVEMASRMLDRADGVLAALYAS
jgi:hypothetical protein